LRRIGSAVPDRLDFSYKPEVMVQALGELLDALELSKFSLVVQGFSGIYGILYALQNPDRIDRLAIFNTPISGSNKLPWKIKQLGIPLISDALVQDFRLPDKLMEGGGGYRVEEKAMNIYRDPWLVRSDYGRALNALISQMDVPKLGSTIEQGFKDWEKPLLLAWGDRDPCLPWELAKTTR
jgi:pimeloyl-ACP methyl ester carboxylesterase